MSVKTSKIAEHDINYYRAMFLYHIFDELKSDNLYSISTHKTPVFGADDVNRYHLCFQRMIQYWENNGFDGFHYVNNGEDPGSVSYVVFRPGNILFNGQPPVKESKTNILKVKFSNDVCRQPTKIEQAVLKCERARRNAQPFKSR